MELVWRRRGLPLFLPMPLIPLAPHDISPSLETQLILELECWICGAEFIK
jgi:hypothetical protein